MRRLLLLAHLCSAIGFAGALLVHLAVLLGPPALSTEGLMGIRTAMAQVAEHVMVPSTLLLLTSGMLLVVASPALLSARWVWLKALLGFAAAAVALVALYPLVQQSAGLASQSMFGMTDGQDELARIERTVTTIALALSAAAVALALWRPRLRAGDH